MSALRHRLYLRDRSALPLLGDPQRRSAVALCGVERGNGVGTAALGRDDRRRAAGGITALEIGAPADDHLDDDRDMPYESSMFAFEKRRKWER
jgi:hypothetical protein